MHSPTKTLERKLFKSGYGYICAVDEVGMGCLAGPVVVCAVGITNHFYKKHHRKLAGVRDSKLLSAEQREKFAKELMKEKDLVYAISQCSPKIIDKLNIYHASRLAMRKALIKIKLTGSCPDRTVCSPKTRCAHGSPVGPPLLMSPLVKTIVLVDGNKKISGVETEQMAIIGGDRKVFAIACASVIAKVYRDKLMDKYSRKYPGYGFEKHKGYGTARHRARLTLVGPCPIHRRSFRLMY